MSENEAMPSEVHVSIEATATDNLIVSLGQEINRLNKELWSQADQIAQMTRDALRGTQERLAMKRQIEGHTERISQQSELLSRAAERRSVSDPEQYRILREMYGEGKCRAVTIEWLLAEIDRLTSPLPPPSESGS